MTLRLLLTALICFLACGVRISQAALPEDIVSDQYRLNLAQDEAWRSLFQQLASQGAIRSQFEELRFIPIRKKPIVLTGEMRLSPERGLSLHYLTPKEDRIIIDERGILIRDAEGRGREVGNDPRARGATTTLLQVLRFDLPVLQRDFAVYGVREGHAWQVVLDPKPEAVARDSSLSRILVKGQNDVLLIIELRRSERQRVEIHVGKTETGVTFSAEELTRFFR